MPRFAAIALIIASLGTATLEAASEADVKPKWHTPYGLYLTPAEAHQMKRDRGDAVLFIDVRTRAEIKYIGMAGAVDAHIPVRMLRDDYAWSKKSSTYRTRENPDFVAAVDKLLRHKGLDREVPIIVMCQSGSRAPTAARLLHKAGFASVYTQYQGFEGNKATAGERKGQRVVNGWKNAGLPWSYNLDPDKMYFNFAP